MNCEGKNADKKSIWNETKYYAYRVSFFCWENNLVSYHTVIGIELPVSSEVHPWVSHASLSFLGVKSCWVQGNIQFLSPNWFLYKYMHRLDLQKHWMEFFLVLPRLCTILLYFFPIIPWLTLDLRIPYWEQSWWYFVLGFLLGLFLQKWQPLQCLGVIWPGNLLFCRRYFT